MNTGDELKAIIALHVDCDSHRVTDNTEICADLGASELAFVRIVIDIEKKFGITVPDEDMSELSTFGRIRDYVENKIG